MSSWYRWQGDTLILLLNIHPRANRDEFAGVRDERLKLRITAAPVDGAANTRLIHFLARQFGIAKRDVNLIRGDHNRAETFHISSPKKLPPDLGLSPPEGSP
ncbi:MAG: DUF167 family protein [Acidiferrobacterales bacterium]